MLDRWPLVQKVLGGFCCVALVTLVVGYVGYRGANAMGTHVENLGEARYPAGTSILVMNRELQAIKVAKRTLVIPTLCEAEWTRYYNNLQAALVIFHNAWNVYEPLPRGAEEEAEWNRFTGLFEAWRKANDYILNRARLIFPEIAEKS